MENPKKILECVKYIMIFGARDRHWMKVQEELHKFGREINCYVVSSKNDNPDIVRGIAVKELCSLSEEYKTGAIIISNVMSRHAEISALLMNEGFRNIFYSMRMYSSLSIDENLYYKSLGWNIKMYDSSSYILNENAPEMQNLMVYVVTSHFNAHNVSCDSKLTSNFMCYIQAGSALTGESMCELKDDTGDNISEKNPFFCELTAGYWISKNDDRHDYVGLYHYSRMLDLEERDIMNILGSGIDVILSEPVVYFSRRSNFGWCDINLRNIISDLYPEYIETYDVYIQEGVLIPSNMMICKKKVYNQFYEWLITILNEYENRLLGAEKIIQPRSMGYIAEELTGIYFLKHSKDISSLYVRQKELY